MAAKKPTSIATDHTEKWKKASETARKTATWAKTMTKVVISQNNREPPFWHVVNFLGAGKSEPTGVVDLVAIRKNHGEHRLPLKRGDLLQIVLIQVKGGDAGMPTSEDRERLRLVGKTYGAKDIVLSEWKKGSKAVFSRLVDDAWVKVEPAEIFPPPANARKRAAKASDIKKARATFLPKSGGTSPKSRSLAAKKAWVTRKAAQSSGAKH